MNCGAQPPVSPTVMTSVSEGRWSGETADLVRPRRTRSFVAQLTSVLSGPLDGGGTRELRDPQETVRAVEALHDGAHREIRRLDRWPEPTVEAPGVPTPRQAPGTDGPSDAGSASRHAAARGVRQRILTDTGVLTIPGGPEHLLRDSTQPGVEHRLQPRLPFTMVIADDRCAIVGRPAGPSEMRGKALLVVPSLLLDVLISSFESLWDLAVPLVGGPDDDPTDATDATGGTDRVLLALLAAGASDDLISRQLHFSKRTVQRRVRELLDRLGAQTRFQAGLNAAKRGWI